MGEAVGVRNCDAYHGEVVVYITMESLHARRGLAVALGSARSAIMAGHCGAAGSLAILDRGRATGVCQANRLASNVAGIPYMMTGSMAMAVTDSVALQQSAASFFFGCTAPIFRKPSEAILKTFVAVRRHRLFGALEVRIRDQSTSSRTRRRASTPHRRATHRPVPERDAAVLSGGGVWWGKSQSIRAVSMPVRQLELEIISLPGSALAVVPHSPS